MISVILCLGTLFAASGCGKKPAATPAGPAAPVVGADHRFAIPVGGQLTSLRLAVEPGEQSRGLMHTTSLPESEGMIFIYAKPQRMSFYMRNVPIPLEIGFFDATGALREIHSMYPGVEDSIVSRSDQLQFALEMNRGWYSKHQVLPGAKIDLAALGDGLKQRGYDPAKFLGKKP